MDPTRNNTPASNDNNTSNDASDNVERFIHRMLNSLVTPHPVELHNHDGSHPPQQAVPQQIPQFTSLSASTDSHNDIEMSDNSAASGPSNTTLEDVVQGIGNSSSSPIPITPNAPSTTASRNSNRRARVEDEMDVEDVRETNRQRVHSPSSSNQDLPHEFHQHIHEHDHDNHDHGNDHEDDHDQNHHGHGRFVIDEPGGHRVVFDVFVGPPQRGTPPGPMPNLQNLPPGAMVFNIPLNGDGTNATQTDNVPQDGAPAREGVPTNLFEHIQQHFANPPPEFVQMLMGGLGGLNFAEEEPEDPERAKRLVGGLEEVPTGLIKRLERVGGEDGEGGANCAVCWESLLEGDGGFGVTDEKPQPNEGDSMGTEPVAPSPSEEKPNYPDLVVLPCSHVFHAKCLLPWFTRPHRTTCPSCRFDIDPDSLTYVSRPPQRRAPRTNTTRAQDGPRREAQQAPPHPAGEHQVEGEAQPTLQPQLEPQLAPQQQPTPQSQPAPQPQQAPQPHPTHGTLNLPHFLTSLVNRFTNFVPPHAAGATRPPEGPVPQPAPRPVAQPVPVVVGGPQAFRSLNPQAVPHGQANGGQPVYVDLPPPPYPGPSSRQGERHQAMSAQNPTVASDTNANFNANEAQNPGQDANRNLPYLSFDISFVVPIAIPVVAQANMPMPAPVPTNNQPPPPSTAASTTSGNPPPIAPQPRPIPRNFAQMFGGGFNIPPPVGVGHAFGGGLAGHGVGAGIVSVPPPRPASAPTTGRARNQDAFGGIPFILPIGAQPSPQPMQQGQVHQRAQQGQQQQGGNATQTLMQAFSRALSNAMSEALSNEALAHELAQPPTPPQQQAEPAGSQAPQSPPRQQRTSEEQETRDRVTQRVFQDMFPAVPPPTLEEVRAARERSNVQDAHDDNAPHTHFHMHPPPTGGLDGGIFIPLPLFGTGAPPRRGARRGQGNAPKPEWTLPPAPGLTLRERVEKREREVGLRCSDISCGVGPSDEDPEPVIDPRTIRQIQIRKRSAESKNKEEYVCEHKFHTACLVSAERVAGWGGEDKKIDKGNDAKEGEDGDVEASCPVCRAVGVIPRAEWDEGACSLA